jgi:hypothetical protein
VIRKVERNKDIDFIILYIIGLPRSLSVREGVTMPKEIEIAREAMEALKERHVGNPAVTANLDGALLYLKLAEEGIAGEPTTQRGFPFVAGDSASPSPQL